jgi:manganese/zinc/iron transport system permease protein
MDVDLWQKLFTDYTLRTVALGSAVLGIVSGTLGAFATLRRQSLLGDAVSHSALPGIALAFYLTRSKEPIVLILGAAVAGWLATLFIHAIVDKCRIKTDSAMGLVLSVFFGIGLVLLTFIQKLPDSRQAGLESFLFGQASAMLQKDVVTMSILGGLTLIFVWLFWKEFKLLSFDPEFGRSMGLSMRLADFVLTTLLVIAIVIGLQTVGVVLMSAMVVAPAAAARQWTDKLHLMVLFSGLFGAIAGVSGAILSSITAHLPTGPTIVVCISVIVVVSMLAAPNRGLLSAWLRRMRHRREVRVEAVLADLYELAQQHAEPGYPHSVQALRAMNPQPESVPQSLQELDRRGLASRYGNNQWALTEKGIVEARLLLRLHTQGSTS